MTPPSFRVPTIAPNQSSQVHESVERLFRQVRVALQDLPLAGETGESGSRCVQLDDENPRHRGNLEDGAIATNADV